MGVGSPGEAMGEKTEAGVGIKPLDEMGPSGWGCGGQHHAGGSWLLLRQSPWSRPRCGPHHLSGKHTVIGRQYPAPTHLSNTKEQ